MVDTEMQGKIRASGINRVSRVKKEDLFETSKPGLFALWCTSSDANEFSGRMISENEATVASKYQAWIKNKKQKL